MIHNACARTIGLTQTILRCDDRLLLEGITVPMRLEAIPHLRRHEWRAALGPILLEVMDHVLVSLRSPDLPCCPNAILQSGIPKPLLLQHIENI
ncbi:hypothetical protein C2S52_001432 [Perilla frutescens var. hirtella]|nr:hypothetical protein C2S52_001432 [Perilla frutescens var. hirtella]